jgi:diamine N-acetyltransferase
MESRVSIRLAVPRDAPALAAVARKSFDQAFSGHPLNRPEDMQAYMDTAFSLEAISGELTDPANTYYIAEIGGEMAGYAKVIKGTVEGEIAAKDPIELSRLYSLDEWIGKGVGKALMLRLLDDAAGAGHDVMWLGVWEHNHRAQEFYRKFGFEKYGEHVFLLGTDPQTDWLLRRKI